MDFKRSDKCDLRFKSISETTILETILTILQNILTFKDRKFSVNTSNALFASISHALPSELAIDGSNSPP